MINLISIRTVFWRFLFFYPNIAMLYYFKITIDFFINKVYFKDNTMKGWRLMWKNTMLQLYLAMESVRK